MFYKHKQCVSIVFLLFICIFLYQVNTSTVSAFEKNIIQYEEEKPAEGTTTNPQGGASGCNAYATQEERDQCAKDRGASLQTADFYTKAILSLKGDVSKLEVGQNYIKNFSNSSVTALSYDFSLVDPDTIIMHMLNIVISIVEMIGQLLSLLVLILYNVASNSFWETIIQNIFNVIDKALFNWGDPNSWFMKVLILFGCLSVAKSLMTKWKQAITIPVFLSTLAQVVISCMLIVFIAQYGRPIITNVETMATESISQSFNFSDDQYDKNLPMEINVKSQIFDIMQKQGFILRHFGVTDASQISNVNGGSYDDDDEGDKIKETGEQRVQKLLDDPSKDNSQYERQHYGNNQIAYSGGRCLAILGLSIVFLVHRIFMAVLLGSSSILLLAIGFFKELTLATSIYALVFMLFKKDKRIASGWFTGRAKWLIMFIVANLVFNMLLTFVVMLVNGIGSSLLLLLPFDILLCAGMLYVVKHAPEIWQKITADFDMEGEGVFNLAKGIVTGNVTPNDMYQKYKQHKEENKAEDTMSKDDAKKSSVTTNRNSTDLEESINDNEDSDELENDDNLETTNSTNGDEVNTNDDFDVDKELNNNTEKDSALENNGAELLEGTDPTNKGELESTELEDSDLISESNDSHNVTQEELSEETEDTNDEQLDQIEDVDTKLEDEEKISKIKNDNTEELIKSSVKPVDNELSETKEIEDLEKESNNMDSPKESTSHQNESSTKEVNDSENQDKVNDSNKDKSNDDFSKELEIDNFMDDLLGGDSD